MYSLAFSIDGKRLVSAGANGTLKVWETATGQLQQVLQRHTSLVRSVAATPDGKQLVSSSEDQTVKVWNLPEIIAGKPDPVPAPPVAAGELHRFQLPRPRAIMNLAVSPDGRRALCSGPFSMAYWDLDSGKLLQDWTGNQFGGPMRFLPDGRRALIRLRKETLGLGDLVKGVLLREFVGHSDFVAAIAVSADGRTAVTGCQEGKDPSVWVWDIEAGKELRRLEGLPSFIGSVAVSPDGRWALTGGLDKVIRLWDLQTARELRRFEGHTQTPWNLVVLPDSRRVLSAGDTTMRLWQLAEP